LQQLTERMAGVLVDGLMTVRCVHWTTSIAAQMVLGLVQRRRGIAPLGASESPKSR
jgi:hypothetical protein